MTRIELAKKAALEAGKYLREFQDELTIEFKDTKDIVTQVDLAAEKIIVGLLQKHFPEDGIYAEEEAQFEGTSGGTWFIDPLDGTVNYSRRIPLYGVSIAYVQDGEPQVGVIYLPHFDELYYAETGQGAWCNDKKIRVSSTSNIQKSIVTQGDFGTSSEYTSVERLNEMKLSVVEKLHDSVMRLKTFSSASLELMYVACGKMDAFITVHSFYFDIAAGIVIIEEAGGSVTDAQGNPISKESQTMIASNGILNPSFVAALKDADVEV